jgi:hypothetical protein
MFAVIRGFCFRKARDSAAELGLLAVFSLQIQPKQRGALFYPMGAAARCGS